MIFLLVAPLGYIYWHKQAYCNSLIDNTNEKEVKELIKDLVDSIFEENEENFIDKVNFDLNMKYGRHIYEDQSIDMVKFGLKPYAEVRLLSDVKYSYESLTKDSVKYLFLTDKSGSGYLIKTPNSDGSVILSGKVVIIDEKISVVCGLGD